MHLIELQYALNTYLNQFFCESTENIVFQYNKTLGAGFTLSGYSHYGNIITPVKIIQKHKGLDLMCAKIKILYLTLYHYFFSI